MRGRGRGSWRTGGIKQEDSVEPIPQSDIEELDYIETEAQMDDSVLVEDMEGDGANGNSESPNKRRPRQWDKTYPGGIKIKKKKTPGFKNIKIRRYVQPKNALMCLSELRTGLKYIPEPVAEGEDGLRFCISVEVDSQKYRGYGSSSKLAKQAAAEAALVSFVKAPSSSAVSSDEDTTPWATLASFAMYKLFNDWRDGRVGMGQQPPAPPPPPPSQAQPVVPFDAGLPAALHAFLDQRLGNVVSSVVSDAGKAGVPQTEVALALNAHLLKNFVKAEGKGRGAGEGGEEVEVVKSKRKKTKKPKTLPENAPMMHPVVLLQHMAKAPVVYSIENIPKDDKPFYRATAEIEGQTFLGEGPNPKKAKAFLAKDAVAALFEVQSTYAL